MSKNQSIAIEKRDFSINPRRLRASGMIPATVYGHGFDPISIQIDVKKFRSAFHNDKTAILELESKDGNHSVLVKNVQYHTIEDEILNIEFQKIKTDEKIKVSVPVLIIGTSPAVKAGGVLRTSLDEIEVECLPKDIPHEIQVDISVMENVEDSISVGQIKYPQGVAPISSVDSTIVKVIALKAVEVSAETQVGEPEAEVVQS